VGNPSRNERGFRLEIDGHESYHLGDCLYDVNDQLAFTILQLGPLGSPPALVIGLALLALVVLVGRVVLAVAWRLVLIALVVVTLLWVLGVFGLA
jgi:hypothetical protein